MVMVTKEQVLTAYASLFYVEQQKHEAAGLLLQMERWDDEHEEGMAYSMGTLGGVPTTTYPGSLGGSSQKTPDGNIATNNIGFYSEVKSANGEQKAMVRVDNDGVDIGATATKKLVEKHLELTDRGNLVFKAEAQAAAEVQASKDGVKLNVAAGVTCAVGGTVEFDDQEYDVTVERDAEVRFLPDMNCNAGGAICCNVGVQKNGDETTYGLFIVRLKVKSRPDGN